MSKVFHAAPWLLLWTASVAIFAAEPVVRAPRIWDDQALEDWATPIAALGFRPGHYTAAEYYAAPVNNLMTYPVYRPDREPPGYRESLQKQKPQTLVDASRLRTREDWIRAGETAFRFPETPARRNSDPSVLQPFRDPKESLCYEASHKNHGTSALRIEQRRNQ